MNYSRIRYHFSRKNLPIILSAIFLILFSTIHFRLIRNTFYIDSGKNIHSTIEGYGDLPLHLTQISKFAFNSDFNLNEPIYYGSKLQYPFLLNLLRGQVLKFTGLWSFAVLWPLYLLAIANIFLLFHIYSKFLKNKALAIATFLIFFLGSGPSDWKSILNWSDFTLIRTTASYPAQNIDFGAPLITAFTNQQTFFLGFFGFLLFLYFLLRLKDNPKASYAIGAGLTLGLLPLAHTHSFVAAVIVLVIAIFLSISKKLYFKSPLLKKLSFTTLIAGILALPQMYFLMSGKGLAMAGSHFTRFRLGWMMENGIGSVQFPNSVRSIFSLHFLNFLWSNFGIILPLFIICLILIVYWRKTIKNGHAIKDDAGSQGMLEKVSDQKVRNVTSNVDNDHSKPNSFLISLFALNGLVLFVTVQLIQFQPWDFDNNKILVYFLFFAAPVIIWVTDKIFERWQTVKADPTEPESVAVITKSTKNFHGRIILKILIIVCIIILSTLSGIIDLTNRLVTPRNSLPIIFTADSMRMAEFIKTNVKEKDLILTGTSHLNPVSSLAGRQSLIGYPGWLWTRGIDYATRENEIELFYSSPITNSPLISKYSVSYILLDEFTRNTYKASETTFNKLFTKVFEVGDYALYSIRGKMTK